MAFFVLFCSFLTNIFTWHNETFVHQISVCICRLFIWKSNHAPTFVTSMDAAKGSEMCVSTQGSCFCHCRLKYVTVADSFELQMFPDCALSHWRKTASCLWVLRLLGYKRSTGGIVNDGILKAPMPVRQHIHSQNP